MNGTIRQEQAGSRTGRGTTVQIFALRNMLEQCKEWQAPVYIIFVDFFKDFDCIINLMGQYSMAFIKTYKVVSISSELKLCYRRRKIFQLV